MIANRQRLCVRCRALLCRTYVLCDPCLRRGHCWPQCPSPNKECTCGFSELFWREVYAETELSVVGPTIRSGDLSSPRFSGPETMTAGSRHSTLFPEILAKQKSGQAMPDSEVKNRGKSGPGTMPA
jgi:hypothetical protein